MTKCIVKGCPNTSRKNSRGTGVTLHGFPNTLDRIKLWLQQIGRDFGDLDAFAQRVLDTRKRNIFRICSVHFLPQSYVWEGKKLVLRKDALPTIFHGCKSKGGLPPAKRLKTETSSDGQEKPQPTQWRLCPTTKTLILENGQTTCREMDETSASLLANPVYVVQDSFTTAKKMVDASTSTDHHLFQVDMGVQWPEYELNFDGESWKVKHDNFYPSILHGGAKPTKKQTETAKCPVDTLNTQNSTFVIQHDERSGLDTQKHTLFIDERGRMHKSDDYVLEWTPDNTRAATPEPTGKLKFPERDVAVERKFIVFESCLDDLFYKLACQFGDGCRAPIVQLEKHIDGTFLSVNGLCRNGHCFHLWNSQPLIKHIAVGNLLCASAILFSGSSFNKVQEMSHLMGLQQISASTYSKHQQRFLFPTVDLHWQQERRRLKEALQNTQLTLTGSSQHGGASLCAKHCTYIFIDVATKRILDFQIEELQPNVSRSAVERQAFQTCLSRLLNENFDVKTVVTDSHHGIKKVMGEKFHYLRHEYDVWQYARRLRSHLRAASRKKACSGLTVWIPSVTNHLFWSLCAGQENVHILHNRWRALLPHIVGDCSQVCSHEPLNPQKPSLCPLLKRDSPAFQELRQLVLSTRLTKDLTCMSKFSHQGEIEVYRNFTVKYRPKRTNYKTDALEARTKLAILAHNANVQRRHIKYSSIRRFSRTHIPSFLKSLHCRFTKQADQVAMREHAVEMICDVLKLCTGNVRHSWLYTPASLPANIATEFRT